MCKLRMRIQDVPYPYCLAINECVICDGNDTTCYNFKEYNKMINQDYIDETNDDKYKQDDNICDI